MEFRSMEHTAIFHRSKQESIHSKSSSSSPSNSFTQQQKSQQYHQQQQQQQQMEQQPLEGSSSFDFSFGWDDDSSILLADETSRTQQPLQEVDDSNNDEVDSGLLEALPPQLHPAVSLGVRRVSSCYFSIQSPSEASSSVADLLSLWDDNNNNNNNITSNNNNSKHGETPTSDDSKKSNESGCDAQTSQKMMANSELKQVLDGCGGDSDDSNGTSARRSILYHDIMMNVLSFLDPPSLAAFSQAARRPNFECFYYLQLQLQRELVAGEQVEPSQSATDVPNYDDSHLPAMAGVGYISRLAKLDPLEARNVIQEYLDSNTTLRTMPLSHSLAYLRDLLRRNGFYSHITAGSPSRALASAALLMTLVGAASFMSSASSSSHESYTTMMMNNAESLAELPNMLFKVGLAGSLMNAARRTMTHRSHSESNNGTAAAADVGMNGDHHHHPALNAHGGSTGAAAGDQHNMTMRETAEQMASMMQQLPRQLLQQLQAMQMRMLNGGNESTTTATTTSTMSSSSSSFSSSLAARMFAAFSSSSSSLSSSPPLPSVTSPMILSSSPKPLSLSVASEDGNQQMEHERLLLTMESLPLTPNPYEHLPEPSAENVRDEGGPDQHRQDVSKELSEHPHISLGAAPSGQMTTRKLPTGCVGAYARAVTRSSTRVTQLLKQQRKTQFEALPEEERQQMAAAWIEACSSDDSLPLVLELVQRLDVDGFYIGPDGTETCALHAAAFSGASRVLEFLCQGLDERNEEADGGLAQVNLQDANGWTALHFAAGANSVSAAQLLTKYGANLFIEAANGYTPLQWSQRLSNNEVVEELQRAEYHYQQEQQQQQQHQHDHHPFHSHQHYHHNYHPQYNIRGRPQLPPLGSLSMFASRFFAMIPTNS